MRDVAVCVDVGVYVGVPVDVPVGVCVAEDVRVDEQGAENVRKSGPAFQVWRGACGT